MNAYTPTRPMHRLAIALVAVAATLTVCAFIDGLARGYSLEGQQIAHGHAVIVASRR